MIPLGLSAAQHAAFERTLASSHEMRSRVNVLNMDGQFRSGLSPFLIEGQVNVQGRADRTSRVGQLTLLDPDRNLHFDPDAPSEHALYRNRRIRIFYDVLVEEMGIGWVEVPLVDGPCTLFNRNGAFVEVEVSNADYNGNTQHTWDPIEVKKGEWKTDVIKKILRTRCTGIRRLAIPDLRGRNEYRIPKDMTIGRMTHPLVKAKKIARSMDRQLWVDGAAVARMRRLPHKKPQFVFRDGTHGMLAADPQRSFSDDPDRFANGWWATGRQLPGAKKPLEVRAFLPPGHPLSPHELGDTGPTGVTRPYRVVGTSHNPGFRKALGLKEWTQRRLHESADGAVDVAAEVYCVPHLDTGDLVAIRTDEFNERTHLWDFSIPLLPGQTMSIGYHKKIGFGPTRGGHIWARRPKQKRKEPRHG